MPSATLAESRLSTPPSNVNDNAVGKMSSTPDKVTGGHLGAGKPRDAAKMAADGFDRQMEQQRGDRSASDRDQHCGPRWPPVLQNQDHYRRTRTDAERSRVKGRQRLTEHRKFWKQRPGLDARQR